MPNQDERIYGTMTVQGASSTGIVRINATSSRTLTLNGGLLVRSGNLQFQNTTAQTILCDADVTIDAGGNMTLAPIGTAVTNLLTIKGNLVNNGIFDMSNATYRCDVTFVGTSNTSISGSGATTDFNVLTVSKGTSQVPVLNVNATSFSLSGGSHPLILNNGTFRLSSAQNVTISNGADFAINATARLSANGGTLEIAGGDGIDLLLAGTVEVLSGTINVGTVANDNAVEYSATGEPTISVSGGTLNINGQVRRSSFSTQGGLIYNQSGTGVVAVGLGTVGTTTRGVFEILNPGSSFTMSGGTLRIVKPTGSSSISDLYLQPSAYAVTGGTVEIGTGQTAQTVDINTLIPLYNVFVTGTTNIAKIEVNPLTLRGSMTIGGDNIFNANSFDVSIAGNFTNSNPTNTNGVTVGGYRAGSASQTTTFNGTTGSQTLEGISGNLTNFGNVVFNNTFAGGSIALLPNSTIRVNGSLTFINNTVAGGANVITSIGSVFNNTTVTSTVGGSLTIGGTSNQLIGGNGNGKFGNVILSNASGATFASNHEITGTLTFTSGSLFIGPYNINLSNTSLTAITGATSTKFIVTSGQLSNGGITKAFAASVTAGNFIYPIGVSGKYTPANYTLTTGASGGTITIKPVNSKHPSATGPGVSYINYYWSVSTSMSLVSLLHTYTYALTDQQGNPLDYRDARFKGGAWTIGITAGNPTAGRVISFSNFDVAGDYTAGEPTAFVNPTLYTSIASGDWDSDGSVWDIDPPGTNLGPPPGSFVIISVGHTVTISSSGKRPATLQVRGRLHLGNTTGHDFGTVTTSGAGARTIQIQSGIFPSGDFTTFNSAGGGTVEYNGVMTLPTQNIYNNITFTGTGLKTLPNVDLTIHGNFTISAGAVNNVSSRKIELTNATGDFINHGIFTTGNGTIGVGRNLINSGTGVVFNAGDGTQGIQVNGDLTNSTNAVFILGSDSLRVNGNMTNSSTFASGAGALRVSGNLNNTSGTFTGSTGIILVSGSLTNNAVFTAGTGAVTVRTAFTNSGASAQYNANINTLTVAGTFTNNIGATFQANSGVINANGSWNNLATFGAGTGSVNFGSPAAQTLTGTTTFHNLNRLNGGSLTLNNSITVENLLTFGAGNIVTGSNVIQLTNTATQPVLGYNASGFIDGNAVISFPSTSATGRVFPVGKGTTYRPVTILQAAGSTSPVVKVEMINTPPSGSFPVTIEAISTTRYYSIDLLSGAMNGPIVELSFNTNGPADENVVIPGNVHIVRATASTGPWTDEQGAGVFSPADPSGYVTSGITSLANPSYFALGYQNIILPISLANFTATLTNELVELNWTTFSEKNNDYFTIERSKDGIHFDSINTVAGAGNSKLVLKYREVDNDPFSGLSYYRLKQTDYDRRWSYSQVVRIVNPHTKPSSLTIYPNPSSSQDDIFVRMVNEASSNAQIIVTTATGAMKYIGNLNLASAVNLKSLSIKLESGGPDLSRQKN
jgi:hypothetical protein